MKFGIDVLMALYDTCEGVDQEFFRTAANSGVQSIRIFVSRKDAMFRAGYGPAFWRRFDNVCRWCKQYEIRPIFVAGYYRANWRTWTHDDWVWLIDQIIDHADEIIPGGYDLSPLNEPQVEPKLFGFTNEGRYSTGTLDDRYTYQDVTLWKTGGLARMLALGAWYAWLKNYLADRLPLNRLIGNVCFDPRYQDDPGAYPSTSDMIAGGLVGELEGLSHAEITAAKKQVMTEWHGVTLVEDLFSQFRAWSVLARARVLRRLFFTNDGRSTGEPSGYAVNDGYRSSSAGELKSLLAALYRIGKEGVRLSKFDLADDAGMTVDTLCSGAARHRFEILYHDLPREVFLHQDADGWHFDVRLIDWQRIRSALPKEYADQWCDRFPEPDPIEDPPPDDDDTQPIEIPEETMTNAWTKLKPGWRWSWPFLLVNVKGFWQAATGLDRVAFCSLALHSLEALVLLGIIIF